MGNIVIVGIDKIFCANVAKELSNKINFNFINAGEKFEKLLVATSGQNVFLMDDILQQKETEFLNKLSQKNNVVLFVDDDMFLSNENYKLFKNSKIILMENEKLNENHLKIQKIIKKYCNYSINIENFDINNLIKIIKG